MNKWTEVGKASLQLPGRGMDNRWLFVHVERSGSAEYRTETFRGALVSSIVDPTYTFLEFVRIETSNIIGAAQEVEDAAR